MTVYLPRPGTRLAFHGYTPPFTLQAVGTQGRRALYVGALGAQALQAGRLSADACKRPRSPHPKHRQSMDNLRQQAHDTNEQQ